MIQPRLNSYHFLVNNQYMIVSVFSFSLFTNNDWVQPEKCVSEWLSIINGGSQLFHVWPSKLNLFNYQRMIASWFRVRLLVTHHYQWGWVWNFTCIIFATKWFKTDWINTVILCTNLWMYQFSHSLCNTNNRWVEHENRMVSLSSSMLASHVLRSTIF